MDKIYRVLGKRGRITIPYLLRKRNSIGYNSILSFRETKDGAILVKKERICNGNAAKCMEENFSVETFLDELSPEEQQKALLHLSLRLASRQGGGTHGRA